MNAATATKIVPITEIETFRKDILDTLKNGGVVLYPTDTQYGLGVIARNREAVEKIVTMKKAGNNRTMSIITPDIETAEKYVHINAEARSLMETHLPGALTLILPSRDKELARSVGDANTIGVRIPDKREILDLVKELGEPITTTSANITGQKPATNCQDILKSLDGIDLAIDGGVVDGNASTVIRCTGPDFEVLRQGSVVV